MDQLSYLSAPQPSPVGICLWRPLHWSECPGPVEAGQHASPPRPRHRPTATPATATASTSPTNRRCRSRPRATRNPAVPRVSSCIRPARRRIASCSTPKTPARTSGPAALTAGPSRRSRGSRGWSGCCCREVGRMVVSTDTTNRAGHRTAKTGSKKEPVIEAAGIGGSKKEPPIVADATTKSRFQNGTGFWRRGRKGEKPPCAAQGGLERLRFVRPRGKQDRMP